MNWVDRKWSSVTSAKALPISAFGALSLDPGKPGPSKKKFEDFCLISPDYSNFETILLRTSNGVLCELVKASLAAPMPRYLFLLLCNVTTLGLDKSSLALSFNSEQLAPMPHDMNTISYLNLQIIIFCNINALLGNAVGSVLSTCTTWQNVCCNAGNTTVSLIPTHPKDIIQMPTYCEICAHASNIIPVSDKHLPWLGTRSRELLRYNTHPHACGYPHRCEVAPLIKGRPGHHGGTSDGRSDGTYSVKAKVTIK